MVWEIAHGSAPFKETTVKVIMDYLKPDAERNGYSITKMMERLKNAKGNVSMNVSMTFTNMTLIRWRK